MGIDVDSMVDAQSAAAHEDDKSAAADHDESVEIHIRLGRSLDRQIKEALLQEADRRGVRRVTVSEYARELFIQALLASRGGL